MNADPLTRGLVTITIRRSLRGVSLLPRQQEIEAWIGALGWRVREIRYEQGEEVMEMVIESVMDKREQEWRVQELQGYGWQLAVSESAPFWQKGAPDAKARLVRLLWQDATDAQGGWAERLRELGWKVEEVDLAKNGEESELRRLMREGRLKP